MRNPFLLLAIGGAIALVAVAAFVLLPLRSPRTLEATHAMPCADLNGDGVVTLADLIIEVSYFGQFVPPAPPQADMNGNWAIEIPDIFIVASEFGTTPGCQDKPIGLKGAPDAPGMSLTVKSAGADCDHPQKPTKCTVPADSVFTLSVEANVIPAGGYVGFETQVVYSPLKYKPAATADEEVVWPDAVVERRDPDPPTGQEGVVTHFSLTAGPSTHSGNIVEIDLNCPADGSFKIALPVATLSNPSGAAFFDSEGVRVPAGKVGQQVIDVDGDTIPEPVWVADTLLINCGEPPPPPPTPTPRPTPPDGEMSLTVKGADCDDPEKPTKCDIPAGSQFTLSVEVNDSPAKGYVAFQTQVVYGPLEYKPTDGSPNEEVVWPDARYRWRYGGIWAQPEGIVVHAGMSNIFPPFSLSTYVGNIVEMAFNCSPEGGSSKIALPVLSLANPWGSHFAKPNLINALPRTVGEQLVDVDGDTTPELVDVADTLDINCIPPTPTPTPTPTDTPTPTPTITLTPTITPTKQPTGDTDGDGCDDLRENGPNPALGGQRDYLSYWDFFDTPDPNATPQRDKAITVADIFRVAARFGATGDATIDPLSKPSKTGYHPAYDRGGQVGDNVWNQAPADGAIAVTDIFTVAAQFGHTCT